MNKDSVKGGGGTSSLDATAATFSPIKIRRSHTTGYIAPGGTTTSQLSFISRSSTLPPPPTADWLGQSNAGTLSSLPEPAQNTECNQASTWTGFPTTFVPEQSFGQSSFGTDQIKQLWAPKPQQEDETQTDDNHIVFSSRPSASFAKGVEDDRDSIPATGQNTSVYFSGASAMSSSNLLLTQPKGSTSIIDANKEFWDRQFLNESGTTDWQVVGGSVVQTMPTTAVNQI